MDLKLPVTSSANVQTSTRQDPIQVNSTKIDNDSNHVKMGSAEKDMDQKNYSKEDVEKNIHKANDLIQQHQTALHFVLHDKLNKYYVQLVDEKTDKVIKEIPPKKFLDMYASILEKLGIIIDHKV